MRILLVAERYWPEVGAAPSRLANLAEGLVRHGHKVDVLTGLPNYPKGRIFEGYRGRVSKHEQHEGVNLFRYWIFATVSRNSLLRFINMFSFSLTMWLFALKRSRIRQYDCVIIQTPQLVVGASAMLLFKTLYGRKCVLNVSDIWPLTALDMGAMSSGSVSYRFMAVLERYLYRRADGVLGQSEEILNHVEQEIRQIDGRWDDGAEKDSDQVLNSRLWKENPLLFLYRNLQSYGKPDQHGESVPLPHQHKRTPMRLVFSGMLGVAQNVAGVVKNVPFSDLGVEFHIFGGGKQLEEIEQYIADHPGCGVFAHGFVPKGEIAGRLKEMDASIVPLATRIRGAFPSKVFDVLPQGLPVLFCGGGEGSVFIGSRDIGFVSQPGDYSALISNIKRLCALSDNEYAAMSARCIQVNKEELDFEIQLTSCVEFLKKL